MVGVEQKEYRRVLDLGIGQCLSCGDQSAQQALSSNEVPSGSADRGPDFERMTVLDGSRGQQFVPESVKQDGHRLDLTMAFDDGYETEQAHEAEAYRSGAGGSERLPDSSSAGRR